MTILTIFQRCVFLDIHLLSYTSHDLKNGHIIIKFLAVKMFVYLSQKVWYDVIHTYNTSDFHPSLLLDSDICHMSDTAT